MKKVLAAMFVSALTASGTSLAFGLGPKFNIEGAEIGIAGVHKSHDSIVVEFADSIVREGVSVRDSEGVATPASAAGSRYLVIQGDHKELTLTKDGQVAVVVDETHHKKIDQPAAQQRNNDLSYAHISESSPLEGQTPHEEQPKAGDVDVATWSDSEPEVLAALVEPEVVEPEVVEPEFSCTATRGTLESNLNRISKEHSGKSVAWLPPMEVWISTPATLQAENYIDCINKIVLSLQQSGAPIRASEYENAIVIREW